jgi:hypothetical protein
MTTKKTKPDDRKGRVGKKTDPPPTATRAGVPSGSAKEHCKQCQGYGYEPSKEIAPQQCRKCGGSGTHLGGGMTDVASKNYSVSQGIIDTHLGCYVGCVFKRGTK